VLFYLSFFSDDNVMNRFALFVLSTACIAGPLFAQLPATDPRIASLVGEISPANIKKTVEHLAAFGTRHTLSDTVSQTRGIGAARRWIQSTLNGYARVSDGRMTVALDGFIAEPSGRIPHPARIVNVIATLRPQAGPVQRGERMIVIGAHYDSRASDAMDSLGDAPGANDDGSGTALVLELARIFSRRAFNTTVVFACFAGEEQGLLGATHWAAQARQQGWIVEAMLNNDIVGNTEGGSGTVESGYVRLFSEALSPADTGRSLARIDALGLEEDGLSRSLARYIKETGERYVPGFAVAMIYRRDRFLRGGDHTPFHQRGFAAVRFSEAAENFDRQHQNPDPAKRIGDLPEFVNEGYCANIARINAAVAATLAWAPPPPPEASIVVSTLEYGTTLHWSPGPSLGTTGYLVRWRETTSPVWQHAILVKDTTAQLTVSKDNYLFGIQAVNEHGDASLITVPVPEQKPNRK
jgi:hypothetical protein